MDNLHGAQDINAGVKTALIEENKALCLGLLVQLEHGVSHVTRGGHVDTNFDADWEDPHVHPGRDE